MLFRRLLDRKELRSVETFVCLKWIEARHDLFGCATTKIPLRLVVSFLFCTLLYLGGSAQRSRPRLMALRICWASCKPSAVLAFFLLLLFCMIVISCVETLREGLYCSIDNTVKHSAIIIHEETTIPPAFGLIFSHRQVSKRFLPSHWPVRAWSRNRKRRYVRSGDQ